MSNKRSGKIGNFFRTVNSLNATTKVLLLVFYTFILVGSTLLIANLINKGKVDRAFKGYVANTEDENIFFSMRLSEERKTYPEKEQAIYRYYFVVNKKPNLGLDLYIERIEVSILTEQGKMVFEEKIPTTSKISNYYNFSLDTYKRVYDKLNEAPQTAYIKIVYYTLNTTDNTKVNKELKIKEKLEYEEPNVKDYQLIDIESTGKIENEYFNLVLKKASPTDGKNGRIEMEFRTVQKGKVKHLRYRSYVSVDNHSTDTDKFLPEYITLANFYGSFNTIDMSNYIRGVLFDFDTYAISTEYNPKFIYIKVEIETYENEVKELTYKIDFNKIPAA